MKKIAALFALVLAVVVPASCQKRANIVIASKPMTEQYILAEMLTLLIKTHSNLSVSHKQGIGGGTTNIHPAMLNGSVDMYPEYTGTAWLQVLKNEAINDPSLLYTSVKAAYGENYGIKWSGLYGFNNGFGIAMKKSLAQEKEITTYSDLFTKGLDLKFAANYDFFERNDGYLGLTTKYGGTFPNKTEMQIGLVYAAFDASQVDVAVIFTTDGRLEQFDLLVLEDDLNYFTSYFAATLVRQATLDKYPQLEAIVEKLTGVISDADMIRLNYLVEIESKDPKLVAKDFLNQKGLLA